MPDPDPVNLQLFLGAVAEIWNIGWLLINPVFSTEENRSWLYLKN